MSLISKRRWESLEQRSATAFLVAAAIFVLDAILVAGVIVALGERYMTLGQVFVGAAWTAAFIGLLGLYPGLADRSRWLSRIGAVCAVVGAIVFAVMSVASLVYFAGIPDGNIESLVPLFLPGVIIGSVLGFLLFGVASIRTDVRSDTFGILLLAPAAVVVANILTGIAGVDSTAATLVIVVAQALAHAGIGYALRTDSGPSARRASAEAAD